MKRIRSVIVAGMMAAAWSICAPAAACGQQAQTASPTADKDAASPLHQLYGTISRVDGPQLTIEARNQRTVQVDASAAIKSSRAIVLGVGRSVNVLGSYDANGVLHAQSIQRAKTSSAGWPPDH
ncbi:MAG TPA: DUF5666 domain-containing protein [Candidatus Dormibacteraeota bacterium]|jgi:hypothetical protein|nr:DUF5666 domain-containing protein [Candidatus Dormibacteraeota bacterium]